MSLGLLEHEPLKELESCHFCHEPIIGHRFQKHHVTYDQYGGKTVKVHPSCHVNHHVQDTRMMTFRKRKAITAWEEEMYQRKYG
jgi:hypothetical protein